MVSKEEYKCPKVTVDIIIEVPKPKLSISYGVPHVVMINRKRSPLGVALPGGFVNYGETPWKAAIREAKEETDLDIEIKEFFHVYGSPKRDARVHAVSLVYLAKAEGTPKGGDDAKEAKIYELDTAITLATVFNHRRILGDFKTYHYLNKRPRWKE